MIGEDGFGFTVTSRDNSTGTDIPIYIKKIVSKGAAARDGRLKIGDRLLEVLLMLTSSYYKIEYLLHRYYKINNA